MKWIKRLLGICEHKWKNIDERNVFVSDLIGNFQDQPTYIMIIQQCEKCGKLNKFKTN